MLKPLTTFSGFEVLRPILFPRDVFKAVKKAGHRRQTLTAKFCATKEDYEKALANGWFSRGDEACAACMAPAPDPVVTIVEDAHLSRAELETEAKRLGVKLDSRNSNERLAERIMEAHAALPSEG